MSLIQTMAGHLTLTEDLSPDSRDREYKGRIKQCFATISNYPVKTLVASLVAALFFIPMFVLYAFVLQDRVNAIQASMDVVSGLGFGFGATDIADINNLIDRIFTERQNFVLYFLTPCCVVAGLGLSGVYNYLRNILWSANPKFFKDFFRGIARHWYKFVLAYLLLGVVATGFVWPLLEILKCHYMGVGANAGWWVLMIVCGILGLLLSVYYMVLVPMFVTYKYDSNPMKNLGITLKNSAILAFVNFLQILIIVILLAAPFLLVVFTQFGYVILVMFGLYGLALYAIINIQYSQFLTDNFIAYLYNRQMTANENKKVAEGKAANKQKNKKATQQHQGYKKKK